MLHVILLILKIIGIVLLVILGLLLLALLTILFVPVRYRMAAEHGTAFYLDGELNWLLRLVHADISHKEGIFHIRVRAFGFVLYDNLNPKKNKIKKAKRAKTRLRKAGTKDGKEKGVTPEGTRAKNATNENDIPKQIGAGDTEPENIKAEDIKNKSNRTEDIRTESNKAEDIKTENIMAEDTKTGNIKTENRKAGDIRTENTKTENDKTKDIDENGIADNVQNISTGSHSPLRRFLAKLKNIRDRIKSFFRKILSSFRKIKDKIKKLLSGLFNFKRKWNLIYDFLQDEVNREGLRAAFASMIKLLKHILPRSLHSEVVFGTGDPCSTGQLLGAMGILYSLYGDKLKITPDFENERLEGWLDARGRIRMASVLIIAVKLLLNKRFKQLRKNFTILKEAL